MACSLQIDSDFEDMEQLEGTIGSILGYYREHLTTVGSTTTVRSRFASVRPSAVNGFLSLRTTANPREQDGHIRFGPSF
jgi:hypothetical protein